MKITMLHRATGGDLPAATVHRFRLTDSRARFIVNGLLLASITIAIAAVLVALGQARG